MKGSKNKKQQDNTRTVALTTARLACAVARFRYGFHMGRVTPHCQTVEAFNVCLATPSTSSQRIQKVGTNSHPHAPASGD